MFSKMFDHRGKTTLIIGEPRIKIYRELYNHITKLQEDGELSTHDDYLGGNELAHNIYSKKYYVKDLNQELIENSPEDVFKRIATFISTVEGTKAKRKRWAEEFYTEMYEGRFVPGGRVLAGAGDLYRLKTLANCFVSKIEEDDINSIYKAAFECARTYSYGGGIGVDISCLRPRDAIVHNAADSSTGAVSFMELFSLTTGLIGQSGRRGALMLTIDVKHPDVMHFIKVKKTPNWVTNQIVEQCKWSGLFDDSKLETIKKQVMENIQVRFANISIKASNEFMSAVDEQRDYSENTYIVYKKNNKDFVTQARQSDDLHYSPGIPSKNVEDYDELKTFVNLNDLQKWLSENDCNTLDTEKFLNLQNRDIFGDYVIQLENETYDYAIRQAGDFMLYFGSEQTGDIRKLIKAREIWDQFIEGNYKTAEPGLIFWTTMSKYSPSNYVGKPIVCTNPCAEVPLEEGGACNLGSINLSRFVVDGYTENAKIEWKQLKKSSKTLTRFLDNVVKWNEELNALENQRKAALETRRLGLGIMGIADMLNQLGIAYDSNEGTELIGKVVEFITNAAYTASANLAAEKGPSIIYEEDSYMECPFIKEALNDETQKLIRENGLRNIAIMSIAPTGSISNIVLGFQNKNKNYIGVSGGVEPIFALYYNRRSESFGNKVFSVFHSTVQAYLDLKGIEFKPEENNDIADMLPEYFMRTAHNINPSDRIEIQGVCQKFIDHSISSTLNLPEDIQPEVISDIYMHAWKANLKGVTVYRDGSRFPILSVEGKKTQFQQQMETTYNVTQDDGQIVECKGDEILKMPNGRLTTVYHHLKNSDINIEQVIDETKFEEVV
jgi:ribonucleoside-diphosphate reductase alpha chain